MFRGESGSGDDSSLSSSFSSSYSSSVASDTSKSSESAPKNVATAKLAAKQPRGKPFVPPKTIMKKPAGKRPLPKRTPLPGAAAPPAPKAADASDREAQFDALHSELMKSRMTIGQRWKEAWSSSPSSGSAVSSVSDLEDVSELDSSDIASSTNPSDDSWLASSELLTSAVGPPAARKGDAESADSRYIMSLLEGELSSGSDLLRKDSNGRLNLTSSGFIDNLTVDSGPSAGSQRAFAAADETVMPRPLRDLKLRLFHGDGPASPSSSLESARAAVPEKWKKLPAGKTVAYGNQKGVADAGKSLEEEELLSQRAGKYGEGKDEEEPFREAAPETHLRWAIDELEEPPTEWRDREADKHSPKIVKRPLTAEDMTVEERLDDNACQEDFYRREMADRIIYEYTGDPLTPQIEKLREERVRLSEWAKRLARRELPWTEAEKPAAYKAPLVRPPLRDVGSTFPKRETDPPLVTDLFPCGGGIEARLLKRDALPSTRVWQMEQKAKRQQRQTMQQREHIRILQAALTKRTGPEPEGISSKGLFLKGTDGEALSPRTAQLKLYEEQCAYLGAQLDEEHGFSDHYRKRMNQVLLKNLALAKRHEGAVEAIKQNKIILDQQRAENITAEEHLADLKHQVDQETTKRFIETSCRQQREEQAQTLQARYSQLVHYLQEAEEKRTSYEDGLRSAQSKAQKAEALLQTKEVEIACAKRYMESQDAQLLEKEVLHRKERDRANVAEREVEHLNETIAAKDAQIATLQEEVAKSEAKLQQAQLEHEQTKTSLQATQTELRQRDAELESLREQLVEQRRTSNTTQQRVVALERLTADFEALAKEAEADEADMEAWRDALEARRSKMLAILEAAERSALGDLPQLSQEGADSQTMAALSEQVNALREARKQESTVHEEEYQKVQEEKQTIEKQLNRQKEESKQLQKEVDSLRRQLKLEAMKAKSATRRATRKAPAYGWQSGQSLSEELRAMKSGCPLEMLSSSGNRRPEVRYVKMFKHGTVTWTEDMTGRKGYKKGDQFSARDIVGVDFGISSSAYIRGLEVEKKSKGPSQPPFPWRCFTIRTLKRSYDFRANSDRAAQDWVVGLGRLSRLHSAPMITSRHELVVHRVRMKLGAYAEQRGVTPAVIWKEAINRTLAQMPHIRHRIAEKMGRESMRQQQGEGLSKAVPAVNLLPDGGGAQQSANEGRQASPLPGGEKKRGGRHRRESIKKLPKDLHEVGSPSGRRRRSTVDSERRRRNSQRAEERRKDFPTPADKEADSQEPVAGETPDESSHPEAKPNKMPSKQSVADEQKAARKSSSKGILSRAGSLFRRATTEASKDSAE